MILPTGYQTCISNSLFLELNLLHLCLSCNRPCQLHSSIAQLKNLETLYMCLGEVGLCIVNGQLLPWLVPSSCPLQPPLPSLQPVVTIKNVSEYFQMFPWYKATAG